MFQKSGSIIHVNYANATTTIKKNINLNKP